MGLLQKLVWGECRDTGHVWKRKGPLVTDTDGTIGREFHCINCGTVRSERISLFTGEVESRSYDHPDGYLVDYKGQYEGMYRRKVKFSKADFRKELLLGQLRRSNRPIPRKALRTNGRLRKGA